MPRSQLLIARKTELKKSMSADGGIALNEKWQSNQCLIVAIHTGARESNQSMGSERGERKYWAYIPAGQLCCGWPGVIVWMWRGRDVRPLYAL